jgi:hypothetical protein
VTAGEPLLVQAAATGLTLTKLNNIANITKADLIRILFMMFSFFVTHAKLHLPNGMGGTTAHPVLQFDQCPPIRLLKFEVRAD